jgi:hypothetical protein
MIANAVGDTAAARSSLDRALDLNAGFDIRQAAIARDTLKKMEPASR